MSPGRAVPVGASLTWQTSLSLGHSRPSRGRALHPGPWSPGGCQGCCARLKRQPQHGLQGSKQLAEAFLEQKPWLLCSRDDRTGPPGPTARTLCASPGGAGGAGGRASRLFWTQLAWRRAESPCCSHARPAPGGLLGRTRASGGPCPLGWGLNGGRLGPVVGGAGSISSPAWTTWAPDSP